MPGRYTAHLRDLQTGKTGAHSFAWGADLGLLEFMWSEGNYACDCHRALLMGRPEQPCGQGRFRVDKIVDDRTGEVVYAED